VTRVIRGGRKGKATPEDSNLDRFGWGPGEFVMISSPGHSAEEIKAFNDAQRAEGLKLMAAKGFKLDNKE
jgi:hypothetical protein